MNDTALLDELAQLAARQIGLRISDDARDRFAGMLRERTAHLGYASLRDYRTFLAGGQAAGEWEEFARAFTTGETFFFRDHGQFDLLRLRLLPELIERHRDDQTLRLWSAGCASGEEVYSLAMLVDMLLPERGGWDILILGTDIDSKAIARARRGHYGKWSFRMVSPEIQQRYFNSDCEMRNADSGMRSAEFATPQSTTPQSFVLDERIRRMVTLRVANLVSEPFPNPASELHDMDLILCRNVFIYFDPAAVFAVAAKFAATLREGGYLMTAHTELTGHQVPALESRLFAEGVVYRRRVWVAACPLPNPPPQPPSQPSPASGGRGDRLPSRLREGIEGRAAGEGVVARAGEGVVAQAGGETPAPSPARGGRLGWGEVEIAAPAIARSAEGPSRTPPPPLAGEGAALLKEAHALADKGEFDLAQQACRKALAINPLAAAPYFLLAQLAQIKGNFELAKEYLNKAIYLDHRFVAAYLELAALCERADDMPRAQTLRRAALGIVRTMPGGEIIEQYETTAGELTQWLAQWEHDVT